MRSGFFFLLFLAVGFFLYQNSALIALRRSAALNQRPEIHEKVLICGICRNVEKATPNTIHSVRTLGSHFLDYRTIIYENNSTDRTKPLLRAWAKEDPRLILISEQLSTRRLARQIPMKIGTRIEKIGRARNIVLDIAMKKIFDDYKYVIWADLDFMEPWDVDAIVETIHFPEQEWDAVFAYGAYDLFALRSPEWPIGFELVGPVYWSKLDELRKQFVLDTNGPWKKVYSAFGGLGIYKRDAIQGCRYSAVVTPDLEQAATAWLSQARQGKNVWCLEEYEQLLATTAIVDLPLSERSQYPDAIGVRLPRGNIVWFSCAKKQPLPSTCEHIPFHASMALHGHDRLFINPRIRSHP